MSEVLYSLGRDGARGFALQAWNLFQTTGRQYWYVGQGTIWLDVLNYLAERNERQPIAVETRL